MEHLSLQKPSLYCSLQVGCQTVVFIICSGDNTYITNTQDSNVYPSCCLKTFA